MRVRIPNAVVLRKDSAPHHIGFIYHHSFEPDVQRLIERMKKRGASQLSIDMSLPRRPRSVGESSQNNHVWGHCTDISTQLPQYTKTDIEQAMMRMAVSEGYPTHLSIDGVETPVAFSQSSVEEAKILLDVIHRFADEHSLWLTEVDPDTKQEYRSIGGRSLKEMLQYEAQRK